MTKELKYLKEIGSDIPAHDEDDLLLEQLFQLVDIEQFDRGRNFFKKNLFQCSLAMLFSLVTGLSVSNLLDVLVATGKSSSATTALMRYIKTFKHVLKWHYGNVWDISSDAAKSIQQVREMHVSARKLMLDRQEVSKTSGEPRLRVTQYDMSLVQCGFIGAIVMYPEDLGIKCTPSDLEDYVYFWRWIGHLLGMDEKHNLCISGYEHAFKLCKAVERDILFPALINPPEQFYPMAHAVTDGVNKLTFLKLFSPHSIVASIPRYSFNTKLCFKDKLRVLVMKTLLRSLYYIQSLGQFLSKRIEGIYRSDLMT